MDQKQWKKLLHENTLNEADSKFKKEAHKLMNQAFEGLFNLDIVLSNSYIGDSSSANDKSIQSLRKLIDGLIRKGDKKYKVLFDFVEFSKILDNIKR